MHLVVVETPIKPISSSCKGPYRSCGPIRHQRKQSFPCIFGKCHKNMSSNKELMPLPACIFCHEAALYVRQLVLPSFETKSASFEHPMEQRIHHISLFQLSPPPLESWPLVVWFQKKGGQLAPLECRGTHPCTWLQVKNDFVSRNYEK